MYRLWFKTEVYDSVAAMYRGMKSEGASLYFVTNQNRLFYRNAQKLLAEQGFAADTFIYRPFFKRGYKHKSESITKIILEHNGCQFLLFGDDHSKDPEVYESVVDEFGPHVYWPYIFGRVGWETRVMNVIEIQVQEEARGKTFQFEFLDLKP